MGETVSASKVTTPAVVYHLIPTLCGPHPSVMILMRDQEDASINGHWSEYLGKTWHTGPASRKLRDPLSARITVTAAVDGPTPLCGPFLSEMTLIVEAEDAHISGEQISPSLNKSACRVCFQETEGSSQCQGSRGPTCSGWSTSPAPIDLFRDDTDGMHYMS